MSLFNVHFDERKYYQLMVWIIVAGCMIALSHAPTVQAQVTTDMTGSGLNTTVIQDATTPTTWNIRGGTLSSGGTNLFHSFDHLSVGSGDTARFQNLNAAGDTALATNAGSVANIIGRVTGGNPSNIYGTIDSQAGFPNANLFLINPAGIVFGPGAALNVGGSVHFSTADYLQFGTGSEFFHADLSKSSTLSSSPVTAFGFLGPSSPKAIDVQGSNLSVDAGQTLTLIGGNAGFTDIASGTVSGGVSVTNGASLTAPSGKINLVSLGASAGSGTVGLNGIVSATTDPPTGFQSLGTVTVSGGATVSASGTAGSVAGGTVTIQGGRLVLADNGSILANGSTTGNAGTVIVHAPTITFTGGPTASATVAASGGTGGGTLDFSEAISFTANNATIQAESVALGTTPTAGSTIDITATSLLGRSLNLGAETVSLTTASVSANATNASAPGTVVIDSPNVTLTDSQITATSLGSTGAVLAFQQADSFTSTNSTLTAQPVGAGQWGSITIGQADSQSVTLANTTVDGGTLALTGSTISVAGGNTTAHATSGANGTVTIHANQFALTDNATLSTVTSGTASGGNILIEGTGGTGSSVERLTISTASLATASTGSAKAGNIYMIADSVEVNTAAISTSAAGTGSGGRLTMTGNQTMALTDHAIQTTVTGGTGISTGDISIVSPLLTITGGAISTHTLGTRQAGGITLNVDSLTMQPGTATVTTPTGHPVITSLGGPGITGGRAGRISIQGVGGQGTTPRILRLIGATIVQKDNSGDIVSGDLAGITLEASEVIELGPDTTLQADVEHVIATADCPNPCDPRNRGFITIEVPQLILNGSTINAQANGTGRSGDITISANILSMDNGAVITSKSGTVLQGCGAGCSGLRGGDGGNITVQGLHGTGTAAERITIQNNSVITADTTNSGAGGNITITAASLDLRNGGTISSSSTATVAQPGSGGNIALSVSGPFASSGGSVSTTALNGESGSIVIQASNVRLVDGSIVTAQSDGPGNAGSIGLFSRDAILIENSSIRTSAAMASGGNITLNAPRLIALNNGNITSSVNGPAGSNGGNISIDPDFVSLKNGSRILAQAVGGNGGNINIVAGTFLAEPGTVIDASSQLGISGDISIQSPIQSLSGAIAPLPKNFSNLATLFGQRCAANKGGQFSSLVQGARDALPPQPGDFLSSPLLGDIPVAGSPISNHSSDLDWRAILLGLAGSPGQTDAAPTYISGCRS